MHRSFLAATAAAGLLFAVPAGAQLTDHLQCFKIKDAAAKAAYTANVVPSDPAFANVDPSCTIVVPAKFLCVDAAKSNVAPVPAGAPDGVQLQKYLCYKTKCEKLETTATLTDQFGEHPVTTKTTGLVCAPVEGSLPCVDADADAHCEGPDDCDDTDDSTYVGAAELCDGADNDCDGTTDEGDPGAGAVCSTGYLGVCSAGTTSCSSGAIVCNQNTGSSSEVCDGADNDCDGSSDEGNPGGLQACNTGVPGICSAGTTSCTGGALVCNQTSSPTAETCNNVDEDCDGTIDDGLTRTCYSGPVGTSGVGVCRPGTQTCSAGSWGGGCPGQVIPGSELCSDGLDNDCDGLTDEAGCI